MFLGDTVQPTTDPLEIESLCCVRNYKIFKISDFSAYLAVFFFEESENAQDRPVEWGGGVRAMRAERSGEDGQVGGDGTGSQSQVDVNFSSRTFSGTSWFSGRYSCLRTLRKIVPERLLFVTLILSLLKSSFFPSQ